MEKVIEIRHLSKFFGTHEVLKDINLSVSKGEVVSIIGSSGSGKSTLLRCINLLEKPSGGEIIYNGNNILGIRIRYPRTAGIWGWCFSSLTCSITMTRSATASWGKSRC